MPLRLRASVSRSLRHAAAQRCHAIRYTPALMLLTPPRRCFAFHAATLPRYELDYYACHTLAISLFTLLDTLISPMLMPRHAIMLDCCCCHASAAIRATMLPLRDTYVIFIIRAYACRYFSLLFAARDDDAFRHISSMLMLHGFIYDAACHTIARRALLPEVIFISLLFDV